MAKDVPAVSQSAPLSAEERRNAYNRVVRLAELERLLLIDVSFSVNKPKGSEGERHLQFNGKVVGYHHDDEHSACAVRYRWDVKVRKGRSVIAGCKATYDVLYSGLDRCPDEVVSLFAENMARSATYTYFRSLFATFDWAADLRLPPLPVLKVMPKV